MNTDETNNTDNSDDEDFTSDTDSTDRRPIGYWLRVVDGLLAREFAAAFESEGVSRRDWMLLNVLSGDVDAPGLAERLARKGKRLRGLADRGWVAEQDGTWTLTDEGRAAKERLGTIVSDLRSRVSGAVSPEDFATTMASLEAIARELGWDETTAGSGRGFGRHGFGRHGFGRPGFGRAPFGQRGFGPFPSDRGPSDRGYHPGFGPNLHHGFPSPWGPGHGPNGHHEPGEHVDDEHRRVPREHGHGDGRGCAEHGHGGHGRGHHRPGRHAERAYERGFDAGFTRGRDARDA